nr:NADH dehydrogenase subunit 6 [Stenocladius bicoloripes]
MNNMMMLTTLSFTMTKHPMSMGIILLMQTITISALTGMMSLNFWYSYILFMILVGGMMVLFIYMTSVASNKKFKMSTKMMLTMLMTFTIILMTNNKMINPSNLNIDMNMMNIMVNYKMSMNKFMTNPVMTMFVFMIMYLLVTLIAVVKITKIKYGPLQMKM